LDPNRILSQYVRNRWGVEHGFPRGPVYSIQQTTDGYIWIGTASGLVRFDGFNFVPIQPSQSFLGTLTHVHELLADRDGALWARLRRLPITIVRYKNGVFEDAWIGAGGAARAAVSAIARANDGNPLLWVLQREGSAIVLRKGRFETLAAPVGFSRSPVLSLAQTADGSVWVGTRDAGLFRIKDGVTFRIRDGLPDPKVNTLIASGDDVWVGTDSGLVRWRGSSLTSQGIPESLNSVQILAMSLDSNSNLWIGTGAHGLLRLNANGVAWMDPGDGHPKEAVTAVFEDREGNLWTGSGRGLERIRDSVFVTHSSPEGLPSDNSGPIHVDRYNQMWFAPLAGGLWRLRDGRPEEVKQAGIGNDVVYSIARGKDGLWAGRQRGGLTHVWLRDGRFQTRTYGTSQGLAQSSVSAVWESRDGAVWAGTLSGGVSRLYNGRFTTYTNADGLASNTVASILEDSTERMWFATPNGVSLLADGKWLTYRGTDGLPADDVNCLLEDAMGRLWIGTSAGLAFQQRGRIERPPSQPASLRESILGLAEDRTGSLWIATASRVLRIRREALATGRLESGDVREYTPADGLRGVEGVKRNPSVVTDPLGRVWFSLNRGISVVNPQFLPGGSAPAIVQVQSLSADGQPIGLRGRIRLPGGSQRIVFGYAGLSLAAPERVRFKYLLEGFDSDWSQPAAAREAIYTNLGPRQYRFRVISSNPEGVWNGAESSVEFEIAPLIWETWWFRLAAVLSLILATAVLYRLRLSGVTRQLNARFEERLAERTRIAQELHDTLLQGFLSASMQLHVATDRLPEDSPVKASMSRVLTLMGRVIDEGRNAVRGLRNSDKEDGNLENSFAGIRTEFSMDEACDFHVAVAGESRPLHPVLRDEVYRIGREALVNAFRHSNATRIEVELEYAARRLRVLVRDNGCGIQPDVLRSGRDGHWGLSGMRERAERIGAQLHVRSGTGAGTEVELAVPGPIAFRAPRRNGLLGRPVRKGSRK
jgi:signal transduction histidine kinase/ligand-binding sensor domain-containing protein